MGMIDDCRRLSDADLSRDLHFLAQRDRHCLAKLLVHLAEYDRRQLCVKETGISLFTYCVRVLGYDEFDAYRRIRAARTVSRYPAALELVERGRLSLTAIVVLHPYLDQENHRAWFKAASGKSRRQIEALIAARYPQGAKPDYLRRFPGQLSPGVPPQAMDVLPSQADANHAPMPADVGPQEATLSLEGGDNRGQAIGMNQWQTIVPITADRVRIGFDAAVAVMHLIDRARQVLRHKYPAGRLEDVLRDALEILLDRKDPQRRLGLKPSVVADKASVPAPPTREPRFLRALKSGRYIPARVKRAVWQRDGGRCAWRFDDGTVCGSRDWLEYDHVKPFARGGRSDSPRNIRLLCRLHNRVAAEAAGFKTGP